MSPDQTITPALTPEEWQPIDPSGDVIYTGPRVGDQAWIEGGEVWLHARTEGEEIVENPHGLAALCLYQQPFGFTHEEIDRLWSIAAFLDSPSVAATEDGWFLLGVAAKLRALLPPKSPS